MNEITPPFRYKGKGFCVYSAADPPTKTVINNVVSRHAFGDEGNTGAERVSFMKCSRSVSRRSVKNQINLETKATAWTVKQLVMCTLFWLPQFDAIHAK